MFLNNTEVKIIKEIDTAGKWWCSSAVLFSVKNGKNTICETVGPESDDYDYCSLLQLNGKPLVQGQIPLCPTCKGLLATGYGIENIDCPELVAARECMNSDFVSIMDSAEKIKPLLGLLADGYYALVDAICFPSDGDGGFFYDVPNDLKRYDAACSEYYCKWNYHSVEHFPLFLYPTQSASLINDERVEYYAQILKSEKELPRALAINMYGFMNALLDGHHKACAAASLGKSLRCLTIIPCDSCSFDSNTIIRGLDIRQVNPGLEKIGFGGLKTTAPKGARYLDTFKNQSYTSDISLQKYELTDRKLHYGTVKYPTIKDVAALSNIENIDGLLPDLDRDVVLRLVEDDDPDADIYLEAILNWLSAADPEAAYDLAVSIVKRDPDLTGHERLRMAFLYLLNFRDDKTEQLFADCYIAFDGKDHDDILDIINSYWNGYDI